MRAVRVKPTAAVNRLNTWLLSSAIVSKALLPRRVHESFESAVVRLFQ